jgi:hypothetical protein
MPYIKQEWRPDFDALVDMFLNIENLKIDDLLEYANKLYYKYDEANGCLNYLFTQLILKSKPNVTPVSFISFIIDNTIFDKEVNYKAYDKLGGLLYRMKREFERRQWKDELNVIDSLIYQNDQLCNFYEGIKQEQNGDLK